ncbi:hypothetical protein Tco_1458238 [Tanacetum coccineum]
MPDTANISDSEDTDSVHLPKDQVRGSQSLSKNNISLQFQMEECHRMLMDQVDLVNPEGHQCDYVRQKTVIPGGPPGQCAYGHLHWWFKRKEFYITRHSAPSDRSTVRSHMQILNVVSLKTYERYGYPFLKEIVLRRADYKIVPASSSKLVIESYQTKLNLTQLDWDASDFLFKEDYIIVSKPRVVIYRDRNDQKKMMRETKVHKFSDGTLNRILDKLDHMVKDFKMLS